MAQPATPEDSTVSPLAPAAPGPPVTTAPGPGTVSLQAAPPHAPSGELAVRVDYTMFVATWVVFALLFVILYKFAFKPIFSALDQREQFIRDSLAQADEAQRQLAAFEEQRQRAVTEAEAAGRQIVAQARVAAEEAVRRIEERAAEDARILLENARREIREEEDRATAALRRQSVDLAIAVASKVLAENLDTPKNRELADRFIREL